MRASPLWWAALFLALSTTATTAQTQPVGEDRSAYAVGDRSGHQMKATDEELRRVHMLGIAVEDDGDLRKTRAICDQGGMPAFRQRLENRGTPFPHANIFCRGVLKEEAKRGRLNSYRQKDDFFAIFEAVKQDTASYQNWQGEMTVLTCERAYDVGFQYGWLKPDWEVQPAMKPHADNHAAFCFKGNGAGLQQAFVAGLHHAQHDAKHKV